MFDMKNVVSFISFFTSLNPLKVKLCFKFDIIKNVVGLILLFISLQGESVVSESSNEVEKSERNQTSERQGGRSAEAHHGAQRVFHGARGLELWGGSAELVCPLPGGGVVVQS